MDNEDSSLAVVTPFDEFLEDLFASSAVNPWRSKWAESSISAMETLANSGWTLYPYLTYSGGSDIEPLPYLTRLSSEPGLLHLLSP